MSTVVYRCFNHCQRAYQVRRGSKNVSKCGKYNIAIQFILKDHVKSGYQTISAPVIDFPNFTIRPASPSA